MTSVVPSGGGEYPSPPALKKMFTRVLKHTRALLRQRRKDLLQEIRPQSTSSSVTQADLLELAFRGMSRGIDLLQHGGCKNTRFQGVLEALENLHQEVSTRIESEVRQAALTADWRRSGRLILWAARRRIRELEQEVRWLERGCAGCDRC